MNSRVHPNYKTKYRVTNWPEYDQALVKRGNITVWLSPAASKAWNAKPSGKRGAPRKYSDLAIETALTLRLVFHLPLRQTEGFLNSLFEMMGLDLSAPDHTTLSRRSKQLNVKLRRIPARGAIHLIVDSSGISIVGEGEWAAAKHGKRGKRGWKKLHMAVSESGVIVAQELTDSTGDDANTGLQLLDELKRDIKSFTGDAAYDTLAIYDAAESRGARVVVPPFKTAVVSKREPRSRARDQTIKRINKVGRRQWKKESGYPRQGTIENAFSRYKQIVGDRGDGGDAGNGGKGNNPGDGGEGGDAGDDPGWDDGDDGSDGEDGEDTDADPLTASDWANISREIREWGRILFGPEEGK